MEIVIGLLILILDVIALISVIGSPYGAVKKLLWIIVILVLPLLGMILWFVLGNPGTKKVEVRVDEKE